jgi:zinc protease
MRGLGLAAVVAWGCACTVELAPRPRPPAPPSRDPSLGLSITTQTLDSGLRVVIVRDPTLSEVQVTMRYAVGAIEDGTTPGIAHLVEHLMFQQIVDGQPAYTQLEDIATHFNATTTYEETTYIARAPTAALDKLLAIEGSRLSDPCRTLDDSVFAREREVVANEVQQRDQATEIFSALHRALLPDGHPYRRAVGGSVDSVRSITKQQACAFADTYYAPHNAVLVISANLTSAQIDTALGKLRSTLAKRAGVTTTRPEPVKPPAQHLEIPAPVDEDILVVAWALPADVELQVKVRAIAASLPKLVDDEIKGVVAGIELGDRGAPMVGLAVLPGDGEALAQAIAGARRGVAKLPGMFETADRDHLDRIAFERVRQGAVYRLYSILEDGSDRDARLASHVAAGRDPRVAIDVELRALAELSREEAADLARSYLAPNTPAVVTLKASAGRKRGGRVKLSLPIHDLGRRRTPIDPALASRPSVAQQRDEALRAQTRTLPNGMKIVLLPVTAVPTFDARLIFAAGTADEPHDQRGVALFAAHTLTWDLHHLNDALAFVRAGGMRNTEVGADRTSFSVQGVDANLDVALAGLRRWVRDGVYDDSAGDFAAALRSTAKRVDDQGQLTDAWRASLFGMGHPYVAGGLVRHANPGITLEQARAYRGAYFTPDNATLVIAGRFDPRVANRWIDFLFEDWKGRAVGHRDTPIAPQPATIARADDTALVQVRIAMPVSLGIDRARRLVAAEMLADIVRDVRFQLGASYAFEAQLAETKLASFIVAHGWVDAAHVSAAVSLIRDRIAELRRDAEAAARAFVVARAHVATRLRARIGSAAALAERVEQDVELRREPLADLRLAATVHALTIADMKAALAELELARATVLMSGPQGEVDGALGVLGRKATYLVPAPTASPAVTPPSLVPGFKHAEQRVLRSNLQPALTDQPPPRRFLAFGAFGTAALVADRDHRDPMLTGFTWVGELGYRYGWTNALGVRLELGRLGRDGLDESGLPRRHTLIPVGMLLMWHLGGHGRAWGDVLGGIQFQRVSTEMTQWHRALVYGVQGGYDLVRHRTHRIAIALRWERTLESSAYKYSAASIGLMYRQ